MRRLFGYLFKPTNELSFKLITDREELQRVYDIVNNDRDKYIEICDCNTDGDRMYFGQTVTAVLNRIFETLEAPMKFEYGYADEDFTAYKIHIKQRNTKFVEGATVTYTNTFYIAVRHYMELCGCTDIEFFNGKKSIYFKRKEVTSAE